MFTGVLVLEKHLTTFGFRVSAKLPGVWGSIEEKCSKQVERVSPKAKGYFLKRVFPMAWNSGGGGRKILSCRPTWTT